MKNRDNLSVSRYSGQSWWHGNSLVGKYLPYENITLENTAPGGATAQFLRRLCTGQTHLNRCWTFTAAGYIKTKMTENSNSLNGHVNQALDLEDEVSHF